MATEAVVDLVVDASDDAADVDTDQGSQGNKKGNIKSPMYEMWNFEQAGKRDKSHLGAQCIYCKHVLEQEGRQLEPGGTCLAGLPTILAHVKNCKHHPKAVRDKAEFELAILRNNKKPAVKRGFNTAFAAADKEGSSGSSSKQPGLNKFMAYEDKPYTSEEQKEFELLCLEATISGNLPLSVWDDQSFRALLTSLRPQLKIPSRKVISTRILDRGAKIANNKMLKILQESDGELNVIEHCCCKLQVVQKHEYSASAHLIDTLLCCRLLHCHRLLDQHSPTANHGICDHHLAETG